MVRAVDPAARSGDVVYVYDRRDQLAGQGLFNARSQIALRMLTRGGQPADEAFWRERIEQAVALRQALRLDESTDAYRLIHAEGDGLSGLIVERYGDCLACELFALGMHERLEQILPLLRAALGAPTRLERPDLAAADWRVIVRADRRIEQLEGFSVGPPSADAPTEIVIREHGVRYRVDLAGGHKTGFFCDQRDNRLRLARLCRGASVLDVCCYTGGFGLAAKALGGAQEVLGVDLDERALELARQNANLNQARIRHVHADAFNYLRQMLADGRRFDVVVLDPPKFATSRHELERAGARYHDLNKLGMQVVRPGGLLLTCSCSGLVSRERFAEIVYQAGRSLGRGLQQLDYTGAGPDHPIMLDCPESEYLKALWLRVL